MSSVDTIITHEYLKTLRSFNLEKSIFEKKIPIYIENLEKFINNGCRCGLGEGYNGHISCSDCIFLDIHLCTSPKKCRWFKGKLITLKMIHEFLKNMLEEQQ